MNNFPGLSGEIIFVINHPHMKQLLGLILALGLLASCDQIKGSGRIVTEKRNTGGFNGVSASEGLNVELSYGEVEEVEVEADDNIIKYIETDVRDGILRIRMEDNTSYRNAHLKVYVRAPRINSLKASSASEILVKELLKNNDKLRLNASSAARISLTVDAPELSIQASSGSTVEISGRTRDYTAELSSGSDLKAVDLLSERVSIKASSGSSASVHASVSLKARASSGSDIRYRGAGNVEKTLSSGGSIEKLN